MKPKRLPDPQFVALDENGAQRDTSILEEADVAYDPTKVTIDLTKEEKRRTTALMLAIQAYNNNIIKDADYLIAAYREADRGTGPTIRPATMNAMVEAAINFDLFISGELSLPRRTLADAAKPEAAEQSEQAEG